MKRYHTRSKIAALLLLAGITSQTVLATEFSDEGRISNAKHSEQADSEAQFDVDSLVAMALESNPSIRQANAAVAKASAIRCQVGARPNPELGYFGQEIGNEGAAGQHGIYVSRSFVRGNKLAWNRKVVAHDVERLRWETEAQRKRVETDVRVRFYRALTAQLKLQQSREFHSEATKAVEVAQQRLQAGEGTRPDLIQSQILVDQIDLSVRESELVWQAAWQELAATVGGTMLQSCELVGDLIESHPFDHDELCSIVESASPLIKAAQARVDRARSNVQRQCRQAIPNVNTQFGIGYDDSTGDAFANVQFGVPIPTKNRNQGNVRAARAEYSSASRNVERLRLRLRRDLAEPIRRYETAAVRVNKYQNSIIPKAKASLELIQQARSAGEVEFLRVLTARQDYFQLTQQLIDARGELSQADSELYGFLLSDSLGKGVNYEGDDALRGQALSGE